MARYYSRWWNRRYDTRYWAFDLMNSQKSVWYSTFIRWFHLFFRQARAVMVICGAHFSSTQNSNKTNTDNRSPPVNYSFRSELKWISSVKFITRCRSLKLMKWLRCGDALAGVSDEFCQYSNTFPKCIPIAEVKRYVCVWGCLFGLSEFQSPKPIDPVYVVYLPKRKKIYQTNFTECCSSYTSNFSNFLISQLILMASLMGSSSENSPEFQTFCVVT